MAERRARIDFVAVAPARFGHGHVFFRLEIGKDALHGALGDSHPLREVAQAGLRIGRDGEQHVGVVGEKGPAGRRRFRQRPAAARDGFRLHGYLGLGNEPGEG